MNRFQKCLQGFALVVFFFSAPGVWAGEVDLKIPDLSTVHFLGGVDGRLLLSFGLWVCLLGVGFGLRMFMQLKHLPVHRAVREISELIYQTCWTYLVSQLKFIVLLWLFIGSVITAYFGWLRPVGIWHVVLILAFSLIGIFGSVSVSWFGIRINTFANSRSAFAALKGKPFETYAIPLKAGISIGMVLISVELLMMLCILLFVPGYLAGFCFIGFAVGESLGAAALRVAGGIFTKIADIGSDLMKIFFKIKEDDARNPGVIADCTGDNAGDSVGPTADSFETYGVTGVALITFILLAVADPILQVKLLVWIFMMRILMIITAALAFGIHSVGAFARYSTKSEMDFERPLTQLIWITSLVSIGATYGVSYLLVGDLGGGTLWLILSAIISCGTLAGAVIPELVKVFTSTNSRHVKEVVVATREGGASLNILSGLVAGDFSGYWMGISIAALMAAAFYFSTQGLGGIMVAPSVFAFGLVAFGFLGMGPVTIAVDSYGPVTDNAQSVYELSTIESLQGIREEIKNQYGFTPQFKKAKEFLEKNDSVGNTFKATAKPVLIGTAVVGATTLIFSILVLLANHSAGGMVTQAQLDTVAGRFSILNPWFLLGLIVGGGIIFWFSGASIQAVSTGAYRAVEFIEKNIKLNSRSPRASVHDSKRVVEICTHYAQKGMFNIFIVVFFSTLAFACLDPDFFIGYLISIAIFGLYKAITMANAGGAWDNAKKTVEMDLKKTGTALHAAVIVGDTVGDPFKDTASVAMNPIVKFTTLFGLLAVELAVHLSEGIRISVTLVCLLIAMIFVYQSFYGMRIKNDSDLDA